MGKKIRVIIALVVIVGVAFWSVNLVRARNYSGSKFTFNVGSGSVVVTNRGSDPIPVEMRSDGRTASFRIESADLGLREVSKSQSSGRNTYHAISFELPPGQAKIDVTRGSNVYFVSSSNQRINAVVTPMSAGSVRTTLIVAGLVILGALYYISRTLEHRWIGVVRSKLSESVRRLKHTTP
jgi:hypothetical protein